MNKATKITIAVLAVIAIGALAYSVLATQDAVKPEEADVTSASIKGKTGCLPPKEESAAGECHIGLRNERGMFLELKGGDTSKLKPEQEIEVKGEMEPPSEKSKYNAIGVIKVESIKTP